RATGAGATEGDTPPDEKLCRELIRRFHAALDGLDVPAMITLLTETQPMAVRAQACANDAAYDFLMAA
ncbi:hypothetical protein ACEN88_30100, partial [Massilia sp. CT11-108]|uniref:hypothetical protein n=1 Tax=Massilia sp. CT11-108 TaxID=3393900 RepID=UPI0039A54CE2